MPYPQVWVEHMFQESMAFLLADNCPGLEKHHPGIDRHRLSAFAAMSDRGHSMRNLSRKFSPITPERYQPLQQAFLRKHNLTADSDDAAFCAAGLIELQERTPIGLMLREPE
ncbi:MAG: DUF5333 family protein [Paracoccaceae bacterium]|nr:DUF5333 family protein [Paracoccaceae bacterium]